MKGHVQNPGGQAVSDELGWAVQSRSGSYRQRESRVSGRTESGRKDNERLVGDWMEEGEMLQGEVQSASRGL